MFFINEIIQWSVLIVCIALLIKSIINLDNLNTHVTNIWKSMHKIVNIIDKEDKGD